MSYSSICTAKAALLTYVKVDDSMEWGQKQDLSRFLKGVFKMKPPTPKYSHTWDASQVLNYIELLVPLEKLTLKELTLKTLGLIALTSGLRAQTMHLMDIKNMIKYEDCYTFIIEGRTKTTRPGFS